MKTYNTLTNQEEEIIIHKGTEAPFSGKYYAHEEDGDYLCKQCNAKLFHSSDKFDSQTGWPSFDGMTQNNVKEITSDTDYRIEIVCACCDAHLGHVFKGEEMTYNNIRYCVNSLSLIFEE